MLTDPLGNKVRLGKETLYGHIYRRHRELKGRKKEIETTLTEPDFIARSKKGRSHYMAKKNLYIGYNEKADELIITSQPKAKTVGYFIDDDTVVLLDIKTFRPYGFSFILLKEYFKRHKNKSFAKIPVSGQIELPVRVQKQLTAPNG